MGRDYYIIHRRVTEAAPRDAPVPKLASSETHIADTRKKVGTEV